MIPSMASVTASTTLAIAALMIGGCSSVGGSAVRTGSVQLPAYAGPVAIYAANKPPANAVDLGIVEVHATQQEATVDTLLPQFVRKVAEIGGNVAVVDGVRARFELVGRTQVETFYYTCGLGATCAGQRVYAANDELMLVSMFGHAFTTRVEAAVPPSSAPLMPPEESQESPAVESPSESGGM
ncbi:hypothetical protein AKJ09_06596 [Labilithrix luteola]|uniref:Lipoprotein n=2 Tax=Labilithrix luteola TaxID=1391654 RepID=A0A0K1Q2H4_9BACT|nr:hypothetical protein AKJ09_06596 [Labilithrix luteola]